MLKKKLGIECIEDRINNCHISWFYKVPSTLIIPEGCRRIRSGIFGNCSKLKKVIIPGSVKEIGDSAFTWCFSLKEVIISEGVERICSGVFIDCDRLEKVVIPESVVEIYSSAFYGCAGAEIILKKPKSEFKYIGSLAFADCRDVKEEARG